MSHSYQTWYLSERAQVSRNVFEYVCNVEEKQFDIFNRFVKLASLYDPNATTSARGNADNAYVVENVVASNVDTVTAAIAATDVRAEFQTDDADWGEQRKARHLEWYAEQLAVMLDLPAKCRAAFKDAAIKGTGLLHVYADEFDTIHVERVLVDDIVVDEKESQNGGLPKQMHRRRYIDREELKALFPEHERDIEAAQRADRRRWERWAGYRPMEDNEVVVIESWRLPLGKPGRRGHRAGRHTICIDGADLVDEEWASDKFPFARIVWSERVNGWYGISGVERIAGHQRTLNRRNMQIDRQLDQGAFPTTFVSMADAAMTVKATNRVGNIVVTKSGQPPVTVIPPAVSPETHKSREDTKSSAFEEFGCSRMASSAVKPAGIDSGIGLREYRDQTTQRFSIQEKAFERLCLDVMLLVVGVCKDLGAEAPMMMRRTRFGARKLPWAKVDMGDVAVQIAAASTLGRTPAGRKQFVLELAQAGVISQDETRRLMGHSDIESAMSLYTAAIEDIEHAIEEIRDGEVLMPEPYQNLKLGVWRMQQAYLKDRGDGAPEEVLEAYRQWIVQAAYILSGPAQPANSNAMPGAMPDQQALPPGPDPTGAMPGGAQPTAALAPEAMNLRAV